MTINTPVLVAMLFAVGAGIAISMQSAIVTNFGETIGPVRTAFLVHLGGTIVGAVMLALLLTREAPMPIPSNIPRMSLIFLAAGLMGMLTIPSIAIAFPRVGLVAGQLAVIGGQAVVALVVDTMGLAGGDPIPLNWQRIAGLALLVLAAYLLLPKTG